jgi:ribA/ribD-fused uncharacterized protein
MRAKGRAIRFHLKRGPRGWLSNFAAYAITLDGVTWPTSEHYYQAQKFVGDPAVMELIRSNPQPYIAWRMGHGPDHPPRTDWDEIKDEIMLRAVRAKFSQHEELRARLLATGDTVLVEHSSVDAYWGDGGDGSGLNKLGQILMQVREELRGSSGSSA